MHQSPGGSTPLTHVGVRHVGSTILCESNLIHFSNGNSILHPLPNEQINACTSYQHAQKDTTLCISQYFMLFN